MSSQRIISFEELSEIASRVGLSLVGVVRHHHFEQIRAQDGPALERWQESGFAAEMAYMRRPAELLARPSALEPALQTAISFAIPYLNGSPREPQPPPPGFGRVARYAWGRDYHRVLKRTLKRFVAEAAALIEPSHPIVYRLFTDAVPTLERAIARHAGIGIVGKNTMLIAPGSGSYMFLAEVLWNLDVELPLPESMGVRKKFSKVEPCGGCTRCLSHCPTDAFVEPRVLDARRCISYLTIEKRSDFTEWEASALGSWVFGCDVCQEVCPFNHEGIPRTRVAEFEPERGAGALLSLERLLSIPSQEAFTAQFAGTAIMRAGWSNLRRNAAAVAANTIYLPAIPLLLDLARSSPGPARNEAQRSLRSLVCHTDGAERRRILAVLEPGTSVA